MNSSFKSKTATFQQDNDVELCATHQEGRAGERTRAWDVSRVCKSYASSTMCLSAALLKDLKNDVAPWAHT